MMKTRCGVCLGGRKTEGGKVFCQMGERIFLDGQEKVTLLYQIRFLRCSSSSSRSSSCSKGKKKRRGATRKDRRRWLGQPGTACGCFLAFCLTLRVFGAANYGLGMDGWMERKGCYGDGDKCAPAAAVAVRVVLLSCRVVSCRVVRSAPSNWWAVARTAKSGRERTGTG